MVYRGIHDTALLILQNLPLSTGSDDQIESLALQGIALMRLQRPMDAEAKLSTAEHLCAIQNLPSCGDVLRARGFLSFESGNLQESRGFFMKSLSFARAHHDRSLEGASLQNLGWICLQQEHFDEAVDWITSGYRVAIQIGDQNLAQSALGNLGWAYFKLGDLDRALELSLDAQNRAEKLGNTRVQINWLTTAANAYQAKQDWTRAIGSYKQAVVLATRMNNREYLVNALEDLAHISIDAGQLHDAEDCIRQLDPLVSQTGDRLDALDIIFAQARIAAAQHRGKEAESRFQIVENDPASQTSMRMGAQHALAQLYESSGDLTAADRMYRTALTTFESARGQIKNEDSKLPFLTNATSIYDDYIHFLLDKNKVDEALRRADQSRAQTLAQGLGVDPKDQSNSRPQLQPAAIARKTGMTLFFYWLGREQSYLWAITPNRTSLFRLPSQRQITQAIKQYRRALLGLGDPAEDSNSDGLALYHMLVEPAASLIQPNAKIVVLTDGDLSQLNFETLIVPGPHPHYWIEDATIISAPSLQLLESANSAVPAGNKLLLVGDAISPNPDYPDLPMAAKEMKEIVQHFSPRTQAAFEREKASLDSHPQSFAYIHFVAHGVASRTDPLDSAIILSRSSTAEDSFKLHARDIIHHPIHARLVTVSACYGSGSRSYAGEGTVGLAWAFVRAGAHNVIGALWEVSDESTPQLMGDLYEGLDRGLSPGEALRQAKLALLHSHKDFRKPFYWAPLQIYTGL
jgi:CHAT domain-containing protein